MDRITNRSSPYRHDLFPLKIKSLRPYSPSPAEGWGKNEASKQVSQPSFLRASRRSKFSADGWCLLHLRTEAHAKFQHLFVTKDNIEPDTGMQFAQANQAKELRSGIAFLKMVRSIHDAAKINAMD